MEIFNIEEEVGEDKGEEDIDMGSLVEDQAEDRGVGVEGYGIQDQENLQLLNVLGEEEEAAGVKEGGGAHGSKGKEDQAQKQDSRRKCVSQPCMTRKIRFQGVYI